MSKITAIGAVVMDTLVSLDRYPTEDTKVKTFRELENTFRSIGICGTPI